MATYLGKLLHGNTDFPILTIDKGYIDDEIKLDVGVPHPPYVMCDENYGGRIAARSLISFFEENRHEVPEPRVAVLSGLEGSDLRIEGFKEEFTSHFSGDGAVYPNPLAGEFRRAVARQLTQAFLKKQRLAVHAFFCCNDEMALGVRDALEEETNKFRRRIRHIGGTAKIPLGEKRSKLKCLYAELLWLLNIKVVGFDGIREVRILLDRKDQWLLNSVDVDVPNQVAHLVELFDRFRGAGKRASIKTDIRHPPTLVIDERRQNNEWRYT